MNILIKENIKPKGGRGKKADYETMTMRIPLLLKPFVKLICHAFRLAIQDETYSNTILNKDEYDVMDGFNILMQYYPELNHHESRILTYEQAKEAMKAIVKQKKSARISMDKLLTKIYLV